MERLSFFNRQIAATFSPTIVAFLVASVSMPALAQEEMVFSASSLLPGAQLTGPNYQVDERVVSDGFLNHYTIYYEGRKYDVVGNARMQIRLTELVALQKMDKVQSSDVYKKSLKNAATGSLRGLKKLVTSPVETAKGIVSGVGTLFKGIGHSLFGGASEQEEGVLKTALGFDAAKRKFAYKFGIDPYTSFPPVKQRLEEISWAGVAGNLTISAAFQGIPKPAKGAVSGTKAADGLSRLVRDNTPVELKRIHGEKLKAMKVNDSVAELILEHPKFSPTERTVLIESLAMIGAYDREEFIKRAILVQNEDMAFFMRRWAQMFAAYHKNINPIRRFVRLGKMPVGQREDGVLIGVLPTDHVGWTEQIARRHATNMKKVGNIQGVTGGELWFEGTISPKTRAVLESEQWVVKENVGSLLKLE